MLAVTYKGLSLTDIDSTHSPMKEDSTQTEFSDSSPIATYVHRSEVKDSIQGSKSSIKDRGDSSAGRWVLLRQKGICALID